MGLIPQTLNLSGFLKHIPHFIPHTPKNQTFYFIFLMINYNINVSDILNGGS